MCIWSVDGTACRIILDSVASISLFPDEGVSSQDGRSVVVAMGG